MRYLQLFADKEELLAPFDDAERGRLLTAMMAYGFRGEEIELPGNERFIWPVFRQMINQSRESLEKKQAGGRARADAASGSSLHDEQPFGSKQEQAVVSIVEQTAADCSTSQQTSADVSTDEQIVAYVSTAEQQSAERHIIKNQESRIKNQETGTKREGRAFVSLSPPSPGDVREYAAEKGLTIDADRFCDFYASKGWRVGSQPMKDWRAAVRTWCARDKQDASCQRGPTKKVLHEQQYEQREYEVTEDMPDWMRKRMAATGGGS